MSVGSKLNTAGKYLIYIQALVTLVVIIGFVVIGSERLVQKEKKDAITLYTSAGLCLLMMFVIVYLARRKYGGRLFLGGFLI